MLMNTELEKDGKFSGISAGSSMMTPIKYATLIFDDSSRFSLNSIQ